MRIEVVREATNEIHAALACLLPQLNPTLPVPDMPRLHRLLADPAATLLVAKDGEDIVGTTTVIVYTTPFWIKARLDEVVVDANARGKASARAWSRRRSTSAARKERRWPSFSPDAVRRERPRIVCTSASASRSAPATS